MDNYQKFIAVSRYARYLPEEQRRETWEESVNRYVKYFEERVGLHEGEFEELGIPQAIKNLEVMPSMRALWAAGKGLEEHQVSGFNCSYVAVDNPKVFDEIMYVLMCGTGVGFSVERQFTDKLPVVAEEFHDTDTTITVSDSKIGWAKAFRELVHLLYAGQIPEVNFSRIRPAGARLKTFGGRASGPEPLQELFRFATETFRNAAGRRLSSIECHDLVCKVADIVVVGGVRRSALISLSNLTDERMRVAKSGAWWETNNQRALANNSACYTEKPDMHMFMKEWQALYDSKSGERGIFNREASQRVAARNGRRDSDYAFGTNPCSEIILRSKQFCNLSEVVVRPEDTLETLKRKVRIASILGTLQATLTDFKYLSKDWKKNTEEEALLGVSLTGIMDHTDRMSETGSGLNKWLQELKEVAIETNKEWAEKLGINQSAAITCVKPSGTVSQLVNSASGIHSRHAPFYIRSVRQDNKDPVTQFLQEQGVPNEPAIGKEGSTTVFYFPVKAPDNALTRRNLTAIENLNLWKTYAEHWCEHKPSVTISVKEDEWMDVGAWVYENFDICSGISFLPYDGGTYQQAPYQEVSEGEYQEAVANFPEIHWDSFIELEDNTVGAKELACTGNTCEVE